MSLTPFNRHNCVAMLNTLYPPVMSTPPTSKLTPAIFKSQREGFFRYIQAVERSGPKVLSTLMQQGKRPRDSDGWGAVADTIDAYLRVACGSIAEILDITSKDHFAAAAAAAVSAAEKNRRHGRKVDSGVSFGSDRSATAAGAAASTASDSRPSTGESSTFRPAGSAAAAAAFRSPQSPSPSDPCSIAPSPTQSNTASRGGSALERIARELRRMGRRPKLEIEEINTKPGSLMPTATSAARTSPSASSSSSLSSAVEQRQQQQQQQQPPAPVLANPPPRSSSAVSMINKRGLRKMKSLGALVEMRQPNGSVGSAINDVGAARKGSEASALNSYEAQRRHRLLYDALAEK